MIEQRELEKLIAAQQIEISYYYYKENGRYIQLEDEELLTLDKKSNVYKYFCENYFGDRLSLTLGPIVKSHKFKKIRGRKNFKNRDYYFDLRESDGSILVEPGETISVASNERIYLHGNFGAFLLPRLSNVDAGLVFATSYIDPKWNGIVQSIITNVSDDSIRISICEKYAICRFYPIVGSVSDEFEKKFSQKSHHYGQSWKKIILEDHDPFPTKKKREKSSFIRNTFFFIKQYIKDVTLVGLIVVVLSGYYDFKSSYEKLVDKSNKVIEIEQTISGIKSDVSKMAISGEFILLKGNGNHTIIKTFSINRSPSNIGSVWFEIEGISSADYVITYSKSRKSEKETDITAVISVNSSVTIPESFKVKWICLAN